MRTESILMVACVWEVGGVGVVAEECGVSF